jgi:hypothetical protein
LQIIGETAEMVASIQNPGMGEFQVRDMNDEINKRQVTRSVIVIHLCAVVLAVVLLLDIAQTSLNEGILILSSDFWTYFT